MAEFFLKAAICLLSLLLVLMLGLLLFEGIDYLGGTSNKAVGRVVGRRYSPPYTSMALIGKVMMPQHHAAIYRLQVRGQRGVVEIETSIDKFDLPVNTPVAYTETKGCLTGHIYSR